MVQIKRHQLLDDNLTGASLIDELGFYDETNIYAINKIVAWKNSLYISTANVSANNEGVLTNAPDLDTSHWDEMTDDSSIYSVYPSADQAFTSTRVTVNLNTVRFANSDFSISSGEITFNKTHDYILSVTVTTDVTSSSRSGSSVFIQIDTGSGFVDIPNTTISTYNRTTVSGDETGSITIPISINKDDKLRIQVVRLSGTGSLTTRKEGCSVTIFSVHGIDGKSGPKGDTGADGDLTWEGVYSSSTTYHINEAVEYNGSSFVSVANNNSNSPGTPSAPNTGWEVLAKKGTDGSGTSITVQDSGSSLANTPHSKLDFTGDLTAVDAGGGVATINYTKQKNKYMLPIWAEENGSLANSTYEWAFGNGANTPNDGGIIIYVPSGYTCKVVSMSLTLGAGSATVELVKNGTLQGSNCNVVSSGTHTENHSFTALSVSSGDYINFYTNVASGTSGPCVVCAWLEYNQT